MSVSLLRIVDYFLPARPLETDIRVRIRLFISLVEISIVLGILSSASYFVERPVTFAAIVTNVATIVIKFGYLFCIKYLRDYEWPVLIYYITIYFVVMTSMAGQDLMHPNLLLFPIILVFGYLIILSFWKRLVLTVLGLVATAISIFYAPMIAYEGAFGFEKFDSLSIVVPMIILRHSVVIFGMVWYVYFKKLGEKEFEATRKSVILSLRLNEVSESLQSLIPALGRPLKTIENRLDTLFRTEAFPDSKEMEEMEKAIQTLVKVAQSMGWLYRAYRFEPVGGTRLYHLREQLEILLQGKFAKELSANKVSVHGEDRVISGPIPNLILLILSLTDYITDFYGDDKPQDGPQSLWVDIELVERELDVSLSWEKSQKAFEFSSAKSSLFGERLSPDDFRLDLIAELLQSSDVKLEIQGDGPRETIKLAGAWGVA